MSRKFLDIFSYEDIDVTHSDGNELKQYCDVTLLRDFGEFKAGQYFSGAFVYLYTDDPGIHCIQFVELPNYDDYEDGEYDEGEDDCKIHTVNVSIHVEPRPGWHKTDFGWEHEGSGEVIKLATVSEDYEHKFSVTFDLHSGETYIWDYKSSFEHAKEEAEYWLMIDAKALREVTLTHFKKIY